MNMLTIMKRGVGRPPRPVERHSRWEHDSRACRVPAVPFFWGPPSSFSAAPSSGVPHRAVDLRPPSSARGPRVLQFRLRPGTPGSEFSPAGRSMAESVLLFVKE